MKAFISWAREQGILVLEFEGMKVTFNPAVKVNTGEAVQAQLSQLLPKKTKEDLLKEEDDLLFASAV